MARVASPASLDTWFTFVGDESPVIPSTPVTIISRATGKMTYFETADQIDWPDVYAWHFGDTI